MIRSRKENSKGVLDYFVISAFLGIITGYGAHTVFLGAFITSVLFLLFSFKKPYIYFLTPVLGCLIADMNSTLGGKSETLFALIFVSSIFILIFSFVNFKFKDNKTSIKGFCLGSYISLIILSVPLIIGKKTFSTLSLLFMGNGLFSDINEGAFVFALLTVGFYYYLNKIKSKVISPSFFAVILSSAVAVIYKTNLPSLKEGYENFQYIVNADFGNFHKLLFFGILLSAAFIYTNRVNLKLASDKSYKKNNIIQGISNMVCSMTGSIPSVIIPSCDNKNKESYITIFQILFFVILFTLYPQLTDKIPLSTVAAMFFVKGLEYIKTSFNSIIKKNRSQKAIFITCLLTSLYNITLGLILCLVIVLILNIRKLSHEKN